MTNGTPTASDVIHSKTVIEELLEAEEAARVEKEADPSGANVAAYSEARTAVNKVLGRD